LPQASTRIILFIGKEAIHPTTNMRCPHQISFSPEITNKQAESITTITGTQAKPPPLMQELHAEINIKESGRGSSESVVGRTKARHNWMKRLLKNIYPGTNPYGHPEWQWV